jgi:hypothetical protein
MTLCLYMLGHVKKTFWFSSIPIPAFKFQPHNGRPCVHHKGVLDFRDI